MAPLPREEAPEEAPSRPETPEERAQREVGALFASSQPERAPTPLPESELVMAKAVNTGVPATKWVVWPDGRKSSETFVNLKAEIWWTMRHRFQATYQTWLWAIGDPKGVRHDVDELIFLPEGCEQLKRELIGPKWLEKPGGKVAIEGKDDLKKRGVASPDEADTLALTFVPISPTIVSGKLEGYY